MDRQFRVLAGQGTFTRALDDLDFIRFVAGQILGWFGPDRAVFGTNFPVEKLWTALPPLVAAVAGLVDEQAQHAIFAGTARLSAWLPARSHVSAVKVVPVILVLHDGRRGDGSMPEGFSVKPHYVSGFGDLMAAEASTIGDIDEHAMLYAAPRESDYTGLMSALRKPVAMYTDALEDRLRWRAQVSRETGQELVRTAWVYLDKEEANTGKFDGTGILKPDEDAEKYTESEPKLPALKIKDQVDLHDLFPGLGGMAMLLDWFLVEVLGWSFYNDVIDKMLGNWNALDGAGAALINVGNAAEEVAKSMKDGQDKVGDKWDGGAAQKCEEYITALREAVNEEGPLNRLVGELLKLIAKEAEGVIADIMINLMIPFEELWDDLGLGVMTGCPAFVPEELLARGRTTAEAYEYLFDYAKNIVGGQGRLADEAAEFIDGLKNLGDMATKVDELEGQIRGFVEGGKTAISTTKDLKELADSSEFDEAPEEAYSSGKDPERDGE